MFDRLKNWYYGLVPNVKAYRTLTQEDFVNANAGVQYPFICSSCEDTVMHTKQESGYYRCDNCGLDKIKFLKKL